MLCTQNNGNVSEWFELQRGCHQGCPIAPHQFLICAEVMAELLRNNQKIKGINIGNCINLLSQFADDANLFLRYKVETLNAVSDTLHTVKLNTGLKVNYDKTSIYRIGSLANTNACIYTIKCIIGPMNHLTCLGSRCLTTSMLWETLIIQQ